LAAVQAFAMLFGVTELTHDSFQDFVATHRFAVVHFWAAWNQYDVEVKQLLEQRVPEDLRSQIAFGRFDIDPPAHWEICRQHNVLNVPFLSFYRDGTLIETVMGKCNERVVIEYLKRLVA
jgi:thioredoxin-like negative regulator of GroEL